MAARTRSPAVVLNGVENPNVRPRRRPLIHLSLQRDRRRQSRHLVSIEPFSWPRCLLAIVSYVLLLTDTIRTGLAIRSIKNAALEPNIVEHFGPYAYPVIHLSHANVSSNETTGFWSYKYDSTSIAMRATASHLRVGAWAPCLFYRQPECDETAGIPLATLFRMIDELIEAVRLHRPPTSVSHTTQ
ncbi:hypothetical protein ATCC90586_001837 [Pythium insidiosum]|nr:hypothetical protein ATCC90586_001837 [Pythium insidiosum]